MERLGRVERLRDLIAELERLPPTKQRDNLLRRARSRVVAAEVATWESTCWRHNRTQRDPLALLLDDRAAPGSFATRQHPPAAAARPRAAVA